MWHHKHLHKPGVHSYPINYSATSDITSTHTSQGPAPGLTLNQPPVTSQSSCTRGLLLTYHLLEMMRHHKHLHKQRACSSTKTFSGTYDLKMPVQARCMLLPYHLPHVTSQAHEQAKCLLLPYHLLSHLWHCKQMQKPGDCFCPIITQAHKKSQAPAEASCILLPNSLHFPNIIRHDFLK